MTIAAELDGGSYLAHYGIMNPWTIWLLSKSPELVGMTPSRLNRADSRPHCRLCGQPMSPRPEGWVCYRHEEPVRRRRKMDVPDVKWAPNQPSAVSLIGKEVDVEWDPEQGGYVIVEVGCQN